MAYIPGAFSADILRNIECLKAEVNDKVYSIGIELFLKIVARTPSPSNKGWHATGLLVNQWYPMQGRHFSSSRGSATSDTGTDSISRISSLRGGNEFHGKNGTITLTNNVEHAYRAEMVGWPSPEWSGKVGPYRMVALSLQEIAARHR